MARSRNIKPGFFTNEILGELQPLARLLFAGLWCHADRSGRLEDRMKRLKPQILPYDMCDMDALAQCLHDAGMIQRYVVDNIKYIQILNFNKHQNPHKHEAESSIPEPIENNKHSTNTVQAPYKHSCCPADSFNPITDSFNPITDSFNPITGESQKKEKSKFEIPRLIEIQDYIVEKNLTNVTPEIFYSHYEANGWMIGKNKMKCWKSALSGWNARNKDTKQSYKTFNEMKIEKTVNGLNTFLLPEVENETDRQKRICNDNFSSIGALPNRF